MTLLLDASLSKRDLSSASIRPLADKLVAYYADKLAFLNEAMYDYVFIPFAVLLWEALVYVHTPDMRCHRRAMLGMVPLTRGCLCLVLGGAQAGAVEPRVLW